MIWIRNQVFTGAEGRTSLYDVCYQPEDKPLPVIIFIHGFKGYKDWGPWDNVAEHFASAGYCFVKYNVSHNGGTVANPIDFPDLDAFGQNRYSYELQDLDAIFSLIRTEKRISNEQKIDNRCINLIGHSRGGAIALLYTAQHQQVIHRLITWNAVSNFAERFPKEIDKWKSEGVWFIENKRTRQQMPMYFSIYEDFLKYRDKLDIESAAKNLSVPTAIIQGANDVVVHPNEAKKLNEWVPESILHLIPDANHTFNATHPFNKNQLPKALKLAVLKSLSFLTA